MLLAVICLILLTRIPHSITIIRSCVPNTQFLMNGRLCYCNSLGQSSDSTCLFIGRRQGCHPGQIIWEECRQCICQENGNLLCANTECSADTITHHRNSLRSDSVIWCTPFRSYYVNCTLCVCPLSGKMSEARCVPDSSCVLKGHHTSVDTISQNNCVPKVMYLFTCLQCLCSDDGRFVTGKCVETCHKPVEPNKRCIPRSFYKKDCNICRCPETGIPDWNVCSKSVCTQPLKLIPLDAIKSIVFSCVPNKFTKQRCIYCECDHQEYVNENACMEQECLNLPDYNYKSVKSTCNVGEMVPICMECFCPRSKLSNENYCTRVCSYENKLAILEHVLKEKVHLVDRNLLKETTGTDSCESYSLFLDQGRYCLCSEDGNTSLKYCTSVLEYRTLIEPKQRLIKQKRRGSQPVDFNATCEPNTYVESGCNFCYCPKSGKIDQKWCSNDNCEDKYLNLGNPKTSALSLKIPEGAAKTCTTGSILKDECNFCICDDSGLLMHRKCTNNTCTSQHNISGDFSCEPTSYYIVDCNICLCPSDGVKNIDKCTKNHCESNFLRSYTCLPGQLFGDKCNICICPPSGQKKDKICTDRTCSENDALWKNIFKISQNLLEERASRDPQRNFELCFPGEEFEVGCKICICPEMGLKAYATCMACDEEQVTKENGATKEEFIISPPFVHEEEREGTDRFKEDRKPDIRDTKVIELVDRRFYIETESENCKTYNITESDERSDCTPGSEYIIRCRICICPYMGSINQFCRPMPSDRYCEKAYPGNNFLPMGRRQVATGNLTSNPITVKSEYPIQIHMPHNHTEFRCDNPGRLQDDCYICECKNNVIIEEHCFKSDANNCTGISHPSFVKMENKL